MDALSKHKWCLHYDPQSKPLYFLTRQPLTLEYPLKVAMPEMSGAANHIIDVDLVYSQ
jgi:hypothetical protein